MSNNSFWNQAARDGAIVGCAYAVLRLLSDLLVTAKLGGMGNVLNIVTIACLVFLYYRFTARRAALRATPEEGYGYGKCLGYIAAMSLFAGVIMAAYAVAASLILFPEAYAATYQATFSQMAAMGYPEDAIAQMYAMAKSPAVIAFSMVLGTCFQGLLMGLIIAAFVKRPAQPFGPRNTPEAE